MKYLRHLSQKAQLYGYLRYDILSQLGVNGIAPDFRVYSIPASNHVYLYEDRRSWTRLIGKCFGGISNRAPETAFQSIKTIFIDSNQGAKSHENVTPDYFAHRFEDVLKVVEALRVK